MSIEDQRRFTDAVAKAKAGFWGGTMRWLTDEWKAALHACSRLAMFDMLPALKAINSEDRRFLLTDAPRNPRAVLPARIQPSHDRMSVLGQGAFARIIFAISVIEYGEIEDHGLPADQVNDGREFLGCTRLDDAGVRATIDNALNAARPISTSGSCCDAIGKAWTKILVPQRQVPGGSLIANLAAAAHYMLSRYHVCAAKSIAWQMKTVIDGYDADKRFHIATGDRELRGVAITKNRPFPPDFGIRNWAYKGADEGELDRLRCNPDEIRPPLPIVNTQEL
ncbi:MAG: hypothetical protein ACR2MG_04215 [Pyrinomonadaceae bacterium]